MEERKMKKKILLLASVGVLGISLTSCGGEENYREKDFNVSVEEKDKNANIEYKTQEEINALLDEEFEDNQNSTLYTTREALFDNYKSVTRSILYTFKNDELEGICKQRMVYDFETESIYFHQYSTTVENEVKQSFEIETFAIKNDTDYTITSTITLDNYKNYNTHYSGIAKIITNASFNLSYFKEEVKKLCGKSSLENYYHVSIFSNEAKDYTYFEGDDNASDMKFHSIVVNRNNLFSSGLYEMKRINGDEMSVISKNTYSDKAIIDEKINEDGYISVKARTYGVLPNKLPLMYDIKFEGNYLGYELQEFISDIDISYSDFLKLFS